MLINIYDETGRLIEKIRPSTSANTSVNSQIQFGSKLANGIYLLEVINGQQKQELKVVKQ